MILESQTKVNEEANKLNMVVNKNLINNVNINNNILVINKYQEDKDKSPKEENKKEASEDSTKKKKVHWRDNVLKKDVCDVIDIECFKEYNIMEGEEVHLPQKNSCCLIV